MPERIVITFKEHEQDLAKEFKKKYSSPGAIIKDFIKEDLQNKKGKSTSGKVNLPNFWTRKVFLSSKYAGRELKNASTYIKIILNRFHTKPKSQKQNTL